VNVPVALNCSVVPRAIAGLAGLTARDASRLIHKYRYI